MLNYSFNFLEQYDITSSEVHSVAVSLNSRDKILSDVLLLTHLKQLSQF